MNRMQRVASAAAVSTAALVPASSGFAFAEPYPWHAHDGSTAQCTGTRAQVEHCERVSMHLDQPPVVDDNSVSSQPEPASPGFPWETVGLTALGAGALAAGGVVLLRRSQRAPRPA